MAATPEKKVKQACVSIIEKYKAWHFFPAQNGYGRAGIPDIIICFRGMFLAVECKAGFNKPTALQEREIVNIHKAGGSAMVVREDTIELLEQWFNERSQWK
jgi:hypothetical protein